MIWVGLMFSVYFSFGLILYFLQGRMIFQPKSLPNNYQFDFKNLSQELNLKSTTGNILNTLLFESKKPSKGLVIYHHGNSHNLELWGLEAISFTEKGFDVVMYDYPKYGKSKGILTLKKLKKDAEFIYQNFKPKHQRIINYGRSLGTGLALHLSAHHNDSFEQTILETPYFSIKRMAETFVFFYPLRLILRERLKSYRWISKIDHRVTIFHGSHDELIPWKQSESLIKHCKNGELCTIQGGTHNTLPLTEIYKKKIDLLLF